MKLVSVIIPTYNCSKYMCQAIDSVLAQTYKDVEVIVIDDGSTDDTKEVLRKYGNKIRYIYQENKGVSSARNRGIRESRGEYIAFLDADDIWLPDKLEVQVGIFNKLFDVGMVCSLMEVVDENGTRLGKLKPEKFPGETFDDMLMNGSALPSSCLIKKSCLDDVGFFDKSFKVFEDLDLFLRVASKYRVKNVDKVLALYRAHGANTTKKDYLVYQEQLRFSDVWISKYKSVVSKIFLLNKRRKYSYLLFADAIKKLKLLSASKFLYIFLKSIVILGASKNFIDKKNKVLFIESGSGFGGSAKCLDLMLSGLSDNIEPKVLYYSFGPSIKSVEEAVFDVQRYSIFKAVSAVASSDLVYINNEIYSHLLNIILAKIFMKRCICHMRGIRELTRGEKIVSKLVDRFIAVSMACRANLIKEGIPKDKIEVIYDGIEIEDALNSVIQKSDFVVGVISRVVPGKGHLAFIKAAELLLRHNKGIKFLIFGDDTDRVKKTMNILESYINQNCLKDYVLFKGWESDLNKIYPGLDIVVCPSELEESFGMNVAEAMVYGKPVLASRIGAYKELINDGVNGLLFEPGNPKDLADKLELLIKDLPLRQRIVAEARKSAEEKFNIKDNVAKLERIIYEVSRK